MAARSPEAEDYNTQCELNECRWEYRRAGTSKWNPFPEKDHKIIETAHVLKEGRATIAVRGGYSSHTVVDLQRREFQAGYGNSYEVRRVVLYTPDEILKRRNRQLVEQFKRHAHARKFADALFASFKNDPDSDDDDSDDEPTEEVIEEKLVDFLAEIGVDAKSVQPAVLFWQMNVKGFMEVTRDELYLLLQKTGSGSVSTLKAVASKLTGLVATDKAFADFYLWNFHYYRNAQEEQKKFLPVATASQVWAQVLVPRYPAVLKHLGEFMAQYKGLGVSLDTWKMMLDFAKNTAPDLANMADFYPPFIDEFVEFLVASHGYKNPNADEENEEEDDDFF